MSARTSARCQPRRSATRRLGRCGERPSRLRTAGAGCAVRLPTPAPGRSRAPTAVPPDSWPEQQTAAAAAPLGRPEQRGARVRRGAEGADAVGYRAWAVERPYGSTAGRRVARYTTIASRSLRRFRGASTRPQNCRVFLTRRAGYSRARPGAAGGGAAARIRVLAATASAVPDSLPALAFFLCAKNRWCRVLIYLKCRLIGLNEKLFKYGSHTMLAQAQARPRDPTLPAPRSALPAPLAPLHPPRHLRKQHERSGANDERDGDIAPLGTGRGSCTPTGRPRQV